MAEAEPQGTETPATDATGDTSDATTGVVTPAEGDAQIAKIAEEVGGEGWLGEHPIQVGAEHVAGEHVEGEHKEKKDEVHGENEIVLEGEAVKEEEVVEEMQEEFEEEPPPDPAAPYNFSDSSEALKAPFELRPDQVAEIEQLWDVYQDATPAYTDIDGYITEVELVYMLKCLLLMTYTPEQMQELIEYCVRPQHPEGHITLDQFKKMATLRQRDVPIEEELHGSLALFDPGNTGSVDREELRETLLKHGLKIAPKMVDNLIKEVDMSNDGTIGIEDVIGTLCIDLNRDDIIMLQNQLNPPEERREVQI